MSIYTEEAEHRSNHTEERRAVSRKAGFCPDTGKPVFDCPACCIEEIDYRESAKLLAPAYYIGSMMTRSGEMLRLYNLTEAVGDHPVSSTLSEETLLKLGYRLPEGR